MAESAIPRLQTSVPESGSTYTPISGYAVAAIVLAGIFAVLLVVLGFVAFRNNRPLNEPSLFALPVAAIILAFLARRHIRSSENTRTGLPLANSAWWIALVGALTLLAHISAVEFSIRQEVGGIYERWTKSIAAADPTNPDDQALNEAFYQTIPAGQRNFSASDAETMRKRFGQRWVQFRQSRIVTLATRNRDNASFQYLGIQTREQQGQRIELVMNGLLKCKEGEFPLNLVMIGSQETTGRVWQIFAVDGHVQEQNSLRTLYGWWMYRLEVESYEFCRSLTESKDKLHQFQPAFVAPDGKDISELKHCWENNLVFPTGRFLKGIADVSIWVRETPEGWELSVPVELRTREITNQGSAVKGRIVLQLDNAATAAEIKTSKNQPPETIANFPEAISKRVISWKVLRLESDLKVVQASGQ